MLEDVGLGLGNLGDIDRQTVAGAISTGTHGTGQALGGLAAQVRGLQLVLADGSVVSCSATERPELFSAARVGLGALGILTTVTLQTEPAFLLNTQERPMPLPVVLADGAPTRPLDRRRTFVQDEVFSNGAFGLTCRFGRLFPAAIPRINAIAARGMGRRTYTDASYKVLVSSRRVHFVEMEYAVPTEAVREAITGITRVIDEHDLRVSFPFEVRFTAADDIPLSTASGRASAYLAVHMFKGQPYEKYFGVSPARSARRRRARSRSRRTRATSPSGASSRSAESCRTSIASPGTGSWHRPSGSAPRATGRRR